MANILLSLLLALIAPAPQDGPRAEFVIVVHEANPVETLSVEKVSKIFLKKITRWESGSRIAVVDQRAASTIRERFSAAVHRRPVAAVVAYWQQQIFSGHELPPSERKSDAAVLEFVSKTPDAVGYVSPDTPPMPGVKVLRLTQ